VTYEYFALLLFSFSRAAAVVIVSQPLPPLVEVLLKIEPEFRRIPEKGGKTLGYVFIDRAAFFYDVDNFCFSYARYVGKFFSADMPPYQ